MRRQAAASTVVLWWFVLGFLAIVTMADTGAGPISRLLTAVFRQNDFLGPETLVLSLVVLAMPPMRRDAGGIR